MRRDVLKLMLLLAACIGMQAKATNMGLQEIVPQADYTFRHIDLYDGMPENYIGSVFRLPDGRMAMRATDLIIWDGARFTRHPEPDTLSYQLSHGPMNFNQYVDSENRLWMKKRGELRVFDITKDCYINNVDSLLRQIGETGKTRGIFIDSRNSYWLAAETGIKRVDNGNDIHTILLKSDDSYPGEFVGVERSADGSYAWLVFGSGDVIKWDVKNDVPVSRYDFLDGYLKLGDQVMVKPIDNFRVAFMTDNCVGVFDDETGTFRPILPVNVNQAHKYTSIEIDSHGNIWAARTKNGVYIVSPDNMSVNQLRNFKLLSGENVTGDVQHIYADSITGGLWLALHDNGVLYYSDKFSGKAYVDVSGPAGFQDDENIVAMLRRADGSLLIGTGKGLYIIDSTGVPKRVRGELEGKVCRALYEDKDHNLWIGTFADGLFCMENGRLRHVLNSTTDYHDHVNYNNIRSIVQDQLGQMWIAVYGSVCRIDPSTGVVTPIPDSDKLFSEYGLTGELAVDGNGNIIAGSEKGVFVYNPLTGVTRNLFDGVAFPADIIKHNTLRTNSVAVDRDDNIWLGTHIGVYVLSTNGRVLNYGIDNGFSSPVHKVAIDKRDRVWVLTPTNIFKADIVSDTRGTQKISLRPYLDEDATLHGDQLSFSVISDATRLITPGRRGLVNINLLSDSVLGRHKKAMTPIFNYLHVSEQEVGVGDLFENRVLYDDVLGNNPAIELNHDESNLSIGFVNLDFDNIKSATYQYRLEGMEDEWNEMTFSGQQGQVNYNRLSPGKYRLVVRSVQAGDIVSPEAVFTIVVRPPWWLRTGFKILWILLAIALVVLTVVLLRRRSMLRLNRELEAKELARRKELEDMKLRFFTNISHELRTPLTLIITPLQSIIEKVPESSPLLPKLSNIHQNARNLLMQVNQLLDFRKLEVGADKFEPRPCNIVDLTRVAAGTFASAAADRNIDLSLDLPHDRVVVSADKSKLSRVIVNLLSNAVKYTPDGGKINVRVTVCRESGKVLLTVSDTGIGIPEKETERIFDRFYQASNSADGGHTQSSSGIGLHLVKEYVQLHGGEVTVESRVSEGSVFTVSLPMLQQSEEMPVRVADGSESDNRPVILLAEDNEEFRTFMVGELSEHYRVIGVADGRQAMEQAKIVNPAIIVSDVMMPVMDGIELTKAIKSTIETSHIPVVLLTAHANEANEADGYEAGADAYISKPFNMRVLLTRISNLIEQQHGRWEKFEKHLEVNPSEISITSPDEELIEKALKCVEEHMDDTDFTVDDLSDTLAMSKATLYRKLQAITGQTPNNFIKTIRLKRAAQLLRSSSLSVSEIAYRTGFSTPKYFSKLFKEEFGVLPTEYRKPDNAS